MRQSRSLGDGDAQRESEEKEATMNSRFADHVTSVAFHLTMSKSMIVVLVSVANKRHATGKQSLRLVGLSDTSVSTARRLEERGILYAPNPEWPGRYELTRAGELVVELLREAGLVQSVEETFQNAS
jgi:hypothetical protein